MLNDEKLPPLLEEINVLIQALHSLKEDKNSATVLNQLRARIINRIKAELPEPSSSEDSKTSLIIVSLGKILKILEGIKPISESQPRNPGFFKLSLAYNATQALGSKADELTEHLNQLEQRRNQTHTQTLKSSSPALGG
jgi:hypothetical protein